MNILFFSYNSKIIINRDIQRLLMLLFSTGINFFKILNNYFIQLTYLHIHTYL